jgi:hypothetical protein
MEDQGMSVCVECGREGSREFTANGAGVVCANRVPCLERQLAEARRQARSRGKRRLPRRRAYRETPDVAEAVSRLIRAIGRRCAEEDLDGLAALLELDEAVAAAWADAVAGLRGNYSDRAIGERLNPPITRQAVALRWPVEHDRRRKAPAAAEPVA